MFGVYTMWAFFCSTDVFLFCFLSTISIFMSSLGSTVMYTEPSLLSIMSGHAPYCWLATSLFCTGPVFLKKYIPHLVWRIWCHLATFSDFSNWLSYFPSNEVGNTGASRWFSTVLSSVLACTLHFFHNAIYKIKKMFCRLFQSELDPVCGYLLIHINKDYHQTPKIT